MRTADRRRSPGRATIPIALVIAGVGTGIAVAESVQHHRAPAAPGALRFREVAATANVGATSDATGRPDWLPADATLARHEVDEYGAHVWIYTLGASPGDVTADPPLLRITAVATTTLRAPAATDGTYQSSPQLIDGNPGQLLQRVGGGLQRVDFLRGGVAYTVIITAGGPTSTADPPDTATVLHVAQSLEP